MIKIVCVKKPEVSYTLLPGKTYEIGRKQGDINFPEDQSISRNHGELLVEHPISNISNLNLTPSITLTDLGSKFGTFVNDGIEKKTALSMRERMNLSPGDRFRFGLQWNEFRIVYTPLIVTTSAVREIQKLKTALSHLGAHLIPEWTERCDFVIMETITLTIKAVCAILSAKRIVKPSYIDDLLACYMTAKQTLPNPGDFLPELAEKSLKSLRVSFEPNNRRSEVFNGKIFLFYNIKHLKKLSTAVECGGGTTRLISSATSSELKSSRSLLLALVIDNSSLEEATLDAIETYKKTGKRIIPESEIGLAALHCSSEKHCNPHYSFSKAIFPPTRMISQTQGSSSSTGSFQPVPETQDMVTQRSYSSQSINVVEETIMGTSNTPRQRDAKNSSYSVLDISSDDGPGPSRPFQYSKKRLNDDNDIQELPMGKKRLPEAADAHLETNIKRPRKEPIGSNKTLSDLFASSSDEDDQNLGIGRTSNVKPTNPSETMDLGEAGNDDDAVQPHSAGLRASISTISSTSGTVRQAVNTNSKDTQVDLFPTDESVRHSRSASAKRKLEDVNASNDNAKSSKTVSSTPRDTQEDMFPTDVSRGESLPTSTKRKLDDVEVSKKKPKSRKLGLQSRRQPIEDQLERLDISKKPAATMENEEVNNDNILNPCPTVVVKQIIIEKDSTVSQRNTTGKHVVNFKRFRKVIPLNASLRGNSSTKENHTIRLIVDGEENSSSSEVFRNAKKGDKRGAMDTELTTNDVFSDRASTCEPQPSTSGRVTRSGNMSPPKRPPAKNTKQPPVKPVNESQADFERHVEGGPRLTRSRHGNTPIQKKPEIEDMWSF